MRGIVMQVGGGCAGARAEDETERCVVAHIVNQLHHLGKVFFRLAGKAHDEVTGQTDIRPHSAQLADDALVFHGRVATLHGHEDTVGAMLYGQMQVVHQLGHLGIHINQPLGEFVGVAGGVANALDARNFGHILDQQGKVGDLVGAAHAATIGVHVLAQQGHFFHALVGQTGHFGQHIFKRAAEFLTARIGHHAVAAIFGAAFHDRDKGARPFYPRRRQVVELFDFRKADIHLRMLLPLALGQQLGQAVQGLRAKHHVHIGRALDDFFPFLAGDATTHADQHPFLLEVFDAPQVGKDFFLRFFTHRAGVEQNQVGLFGVVCRLIPFGCAQHIGHLGRVVLVHLAAKGFDKYFFTWFLRSSGCHRCMPLKQSPQGLHICCQPQG